MAEAHFAVSAYLPALPTAAFEPVSPRLGILLPGSPADHEAPWEAVRADLVGQPDQLVWAELIWRLLAALRLRGGGWQGISRRHFLRELRAEADRSFARHGVRVERLVPHSLLANPTVVETASGYIFLAAVNGLLSADYTEQHYGRHDFGICFNEHTLKFIAKHWPPTAS